MSGFGEKYSFWHASLFDNLDSLRDEFGSVWLIGHRTGEDDRGFTPVSSPVFGTTTDPRFDIEYGPVVETTAEFAPYVAHHQQVKLIAKEANYPRTATGLSACIDCGFLDDVRAALTIEDSFATEWLDWSTANVLSLFSNTISYTSMGSLSQIPSACWHDISTPLDEEDVHQAFLHEQSIGDYMEGVVTFEYGDYIENLEQVQSTLDEEDIPNFYLLLSVMTPAADLELPHSPLFSSAVNYLLGECSEFNSTLEDASTGFKDFLVSAEKAAILPEDDGYKEYFSLRGDIEFSTSTVEAGIADKIRDVNLDCRLLKWMTEKGPEAGSLSTNAIFERIDESDGSTLISVETDSELNIKSYDLFKFCGLYGEDYASLQVGAMLPDDVAVVGEDPSSVLATIYNNTTSTSTEMFSQAGAEAITVAHEDFSNLLTQALSGLNGHNKTYQQVFGGSKPYSETMAYRISKYKKSEMYTGGGGGHTTDQLEIVNRIIENDTQAIQNVWLANSSAVDVMEYVDTQMKYNENYVFVVWAYNLVLGTRYFYSNYRTSESLNEIIDLSAPLSNEEIFLGSTSNSLSDAGWTLGETIKPDPARTTYGPEFYTSTINDSFVLDITDNCEVTFTATTMPMAVIKEVPYFVWPGSIMDKPPIVPDINLIPSCENDSELLILLNNSAGTDFLMDPIVINEAEQAIFDEIRGAQGLYTGEIEFGSDNPVSSYEVYRTTEPPSSYSDFAGSLLTTVSTIFDEDLGRIANAASYIDDIESGVTYYYTFRSIDEHGHFSNPTAVYEVELYNEDGVFIPTVSILEMEEEDIKDDSKAAKSNLHIVPRITQAVAGENPSILDGISALGFSEANPPELGAETERLWGKTFKVRMISRKTRRKFDINITFGTEHVQSEIPPDLCEPEEEIFL